MAAAGGACKLSADFAYDDIDAGVGACADAAGSSWSSAAEPALPFGKRCELHALKYSPNCTWMHEETRAIGCPCGALDGLKVKYGRSNRNDLDTYDVKLRCARTWGKWAGLKFVHRDQLTADSATCPDGESVTGVEVTYSRYERKDLDLYDFRLKCGGTWLDHPLELHPHRPGTQPNNCTTARLECPVGEGACGLEVARARQEDGDVDELDVRLRCAARFCPGPAANA